MAGMLSAMAGGGHVTTPLASGPQTRPFPSQYVGEVDAAAAREQLDVVLADARDRQGVAAGPGQRDASGTFPQNAVRYPASRARRRAVGPAVCQGSRDG